MEQIKKFKHLEIPEALEKRITLLTTQVQNGRKSNDFSEDSLLMPVVEESAESVGLTSEEEKKSRR